jgi:hypothetical protein
LFKAISLALLACTALSVQPALRGTTFVASNTNIASAPVDAPPPPDDPPCPQKRTGTTEGTFHDYTIRVYRSPDAEACLQIAQRGTVVFTLENHDFRIGGNMSGDSQIPLGTDITGTGQPDVVVIAWSGGAHCCATLYLLELGEQFREIQKIELDNSDLPNFSRSRDGRYELTTSDWAFQYWKTSFAESPAPTVVLKFRDGQFRIAFDAMRKPAPTVKQFAAMVQTVKSDPDWSAANLPGNCGMNCGVPVALWKEMLTLLYTGHSDLAWQLFDQSWPTAQKGKSGFAAAFCKQLATSHYWSDLQADLGPCPPAGQP